MTMLLLYASVIMLALGVFANRAVARRLVTVRRSMAADEQAMRDLDRDLLGAQRTLHDAERRLEEADARIEQGRAALQAAEADLEKARRAPVERFHVFDRLEPRPGIIWAARVELTTDATSGTTRLAAAWGGTRTYLIAAASQREALDRLVQRFPRNTGYAVGAVSPCGLFTARKQRPGQADEAPILIGSDRKRA